MLTLPTEITNYKDKISLDPVLLIDFIDEDYYIASKSYYTIKDFGDDGSTSGNAFTAVSAHFITYEVEVGDTVNIDGSDYEVDTIIDETHLDLTSVPLGGSNLDWYIEKITYLDLIKKNVSIPITIGLTELVNGLSTISGSTIALVDWRGTIRSGLVGSTPDLTDSSVNIYLKLNSINDQHSSNQVLIYTGKIASYKINKDIITLTLKDRNPITGKYPENLLMNDNPSTVATEEMTKPLQYGDFLMDQDLRWWGDVDGHLAACPIHTGNDEGWSDWTVYIADHEMNEVITVAMLDIENQDGVGCFLYRGEELLLCEFPGGGSITNTAGGAYLTIEKHLQGSEYRAGSAFMMRSPTAENAMNDVATWANAVDGKMSTSAYVAYSGGTVDLYVDTLVFTDQSSEELLVYGTDSIETYCQIYVGTVTGNITIYVYNNGSFGSAIIDSGDSNSWITINAGSTTSRFATLADIDTYCGVLVRAGSPGESVYVHNIIILARVADIATDDQFIYMRAKGREYSGTWGARKTAGNLITNSADMIESIFRDEFGVTNLNTDSFDALNTIWSSVNICASIYIQVLWSELLKEICEAFAISLSYNPTGNWYVFQPTDNLSFSSSGTGTAGNEDIFTDTDSISDEEYAQHPIEKGSLNLSRSDAKDRYDKVTIKYKYNHTAGFIESVSNGSGDIEIIIENRYLGDSSSVTALLGIIRFWFQNQKFIANFMTFYNAIAKEVGDIINIRHDDLNNSILTSGSVNNQKWMVTGHKFTWHPAKIMITAIEIATP